MLFKPQLINEIVLGNKTQTRRPIKPGEHQHTEYKPFGVYQNKREKVIIGKDYAVQPGRGQAGILWHPETKATITADGHQLVVSRQSALGAGFVPLRIRILDIRSEDVRDISHADALAEGFCHAPKHEFLWTWCIFYDYSMYEELLVTEYDPNSPGHCPLFLRVRPDEKYQAWVYTFEVVKK